MNEHAMEPQADAATARPQPRPVRVMLRDQRVFQANIYSYAGELLPRILAARDRFVNFTEIEWLDSALEPQRHLSVRLGNILWIGSTTGEIPLTGVLRETRAERPVRVFVEGGAALEALINLAVEYRISDYFDNAGDFVPLHGVRSRQISELPEQIALQQDAIAAVEDLGRR